ncbi:MAG: tetratricopeptide repeat protein [Armatimonadetes bacterium]|nr:tetratricopeptide repeat protein [Armatimonadota bacterium]
MPHYDVLRARKAGEMSKGTHVLLSMMFLWVLVALVAPHCYGAQQDFGQAGPDLSTLTKNASPAVGVVVTFDTTGEPLMQGTAFFVRPEGIAITCHHVIEDAASAVVRMENGGFFPVEGTLAADPTRDIAVFKVTGKNLPTVPLGDSSALHPGQRVVGITAPEGLENTVADGLVSAIRELPSGSLIQVSVPISSGSSGGPIFDLQGRVVAVAAAVYREGQALNFCIPINAAARLLERSEKVTPLTPPTEPDDLEEWLRDRVTQPPTTSASDCWLEGMDATSEGRYQDAIEHLKAALELDASFYKAHCCLGNTYADLGRYEEAIAAFRAAIRLEPNDAEAHYNLGVTYGKAGRPQEALEAYRQAIRLEPDSAKSYCNLGVAYGELGRYEESIAAHETAVRLEPDDAKGHYNLGCAYAQLGSYEEAITAYKEAIRLEPEYAQAHYNLAWTYGQIGCHDERIAAYKQVIRLEPDNARAHYNLGWTYDELGRHEEAIGAYQQAIRLEPDNADAQFNLGWVYDQLGRYEEAILAYRQAIRLEPEDVAARFNVGVAHAKTGRYHQAIAAFKQVVRLAPDDAGAHYNLALAYLEIGDRSEALDQFRILKYLDPDLAQALFDALYP